MGKKLTQNEVQAILLKDGYFALEPYANMTSKLLIRCPKGHETRFLLGNFISRNVRCKTCNGQEMSKLFKTPYDEVKFNVENKGSLLITSKEEWEVNTHKKGKIEVECICGKIRKISIGSFNIHPLCKSCGIKKGAVAKRYKTIEFVKAFVEANGYSLITDEYKGSKQPLVLNCAKHGEWKTRWNDIDQGHWCRQCGSGKSKPQEEISQYVTSIYSGKIINNCRKMLSGLEIDIYIPELKVGIEHDGLRWHSELFREKPNKTNTEKLKRAKEANVTLLVFYEDEWKNKKPIVKSIIKNKLGLISNKIHARKTEFVEITNKEAKVFLETNHIDGYVRSTKSLGLKHNNRLVMVMTFRKTMRGENEIARMATLIDHVVVGGASKLLKHAPKPLITYSNSRFSQGNVYQKNGFIEITETFQPSYYYTDFKKRVFRTKCMKIKELPGNERKQALAGAFSKHFGHDGPVYRIYDYGHRKWLKRD